MSSKFSYDPKRMKKVFVISAALVIFMAAGNFMERDRKYEISGSKGTSASESAEAEEDISQEVQQEAVSTFADAYEDEAAAKLAADTIYVDITGEVNTPDLIELGAGERLQSAIDMAGGLTDNADRNAVNMAQRLVDGAQYIIPSKGEALIINYPQSCSLLGKLLELVLLTHSKKGDLAKGYPKIDLKAYESGQSRQIILLAFLRCPLILVIQVVLCHLCLQLCYFPKSRKSLYLRFS